MSDEPQPSRIVRIADAPLPTPDPWAGDPPGIRRCPACALADPGAQRCRRCKAALTVLAKQRGKLTINMVNLCVVLVGCRPMLLAICLLFRDSEPLLSLPLLYMGLTVPLAGLIGGLLLMRRTWAWYLAMGFAGIDLLAQLAFQLITPRHPLIPISALAADLMIMGLLLTVFDELRREVLTIDLLPDHALPKTPFDLYSRGVEYSQKQLWYLAARAWQRAVALGHHEPRYRRALGLAYLRLNEHAAAEAELRAALALDPADTRAAELLKLSLGEK